MALTSNCSRLSDSKSQTPSSIRERSFLFRQGRVTAATRFAGIHWHSSEVGSKGIIRERLCRG